MGRDRQPVRRGARSKHRPYQIRPTQAFADDVAAQIAWLRVHRDLGWISRLESELEVARSLLAQFPHLGATSGAEPFRRLLLRRLPFVIWYEIDSDVVRLHRLFHAHQDRRGAPLSRPR